MIALLACSFALVLSAEYTVDWSKCTSENVCFCPPDSGDNPNEHLKQILDVSNTGTCSKSGMQSRFLTDEILLFQLQVQEDQISLGNENPTFILYQEQHHFGCEFNTTDNKAYLVIKDSLWINRYKISLFEDRSRFDAKTGYVLCSFKMERYSTTFFDNIPSATTTMTLKAAQERKYTHDAPSKMFFARITISGDKRPIQCDPYSFNDLLTHEHYHVQPILNRDGNELNCENYGISYKMKFRKDGKNKGKDYDMKKLNCIPTSATYVKDDYYMYELVKNKLNANGEVELDGNGVEIELKTKLYNSEKYTFFCVEKFSKVCVDPNQGNCLLPGDTTCPDYHAGTKDDDATIKCADNRWLINGQYLVLDADPVCRRDPAKNQNDAAFFSSYLGDEIKIEKGARCFAKYDECATNTNLFLPVCDDGETKCGVDESDKMTMKCHDPTKQMQVVLKGEVNATNVTALTCNVESGFWDIPETVKRAVPASSVVKCINKTAVDMVARKAGMSEKLVDIITYSVAAGTCVFIILASSIAMFCITHRHKRNIRKNKEWTKMKKNERIAECKELLPQALLASSETSSLILQGLQMVDLLLDMESENLGDWEEAFKFLLRFQGTITRIDHHIWCMFARYTYVQAKKIIDKHDWLTKTPIRNNSQKGLIRAIAIRLLSFSLYDPSSDPNEDAEELILAGFRKLGFRGVEQYPHCGVMWSVMMHTRIEYRKHTTLPSTNNLNDEGFVNTLRDIGCKKKLPNQIPKEDIIPGMGSVAQQAAFAYGGSNNQNYQTSHMRAKWLDWSGNEEGGEVPMSFLEGMCQTLTHNPCGTILDVCYMWPHPNPDLVAQMKAMASEDKWYAIIMEGIRHATYYGRNLDAMRLKERFLPSKYDDELAKLPKQQQQFEEAMEQMKEEVRAWFAELTDKEELKKKPDYTIKSKIKLDDRVTAQGVGNLNKQGGDACTPDLKSASKSESKKESNSNSSDNDPNAAAAAPAAPAAPAPTPDTAAAAAAPQ